MGKARLLLDGDKLLAFLTQRYRIMQDQVDRDFGGHLGVRLGECREAKWLKEAIERGEFDYGGSVEIGGRNGNDHGRTD